MSILSLLLLFFPWMSLNDVLEGVKDEKINPCEADVNNLCATAFPTSYQGLLEARHCLRANIDEVSKSCIEYLTVTRKSILEPCYVEITEHCRNVVPVSSDQIIKDCLLKYDNSLSLQCFEAVKEEVFDEAEVHCSFLNPSSENALGTPQNTYLTSFFASFKTSMFQAAHDACIEHYSRLDQYQE